MTPLVAALASLQGSGAVKVFEPHRVSTSSTATPASNGLSVYADALVASIVEPSIVIGWSMGGMIAIEAAAAAPDRIAALVLLATSPRFCQDVDYRFGFPTERVETLAQGLQQDIEGTLRTFLTWGAKPFETSDEALESQVSAAKHMGVTQLLQGLQYLLSSDLRSLLPGITPPTLVVHGRKDAIVPWRGGKLVADTIPGAQWERQEHASHDFPLRSPRLLADCINAFFNTLDLTEHTPRERNR